MIRDRRMYTVIALMVASFLTAVDMTIVETAMPRIIGALGGFSLYTWVITVYMLTSTATIPVYGKLADVIGRKLTFTIGAIIFVVGSALCGLSHTMLQLIVFRGLQGIGAGAILPVVQTIIGDIFTPAERAKFQAWFSAVWGFSGLIGPLLGGLIVDHASWRWLFYINLPFGILALYMVGRYLDETIVRRKVDIDYLGSITLTLGVTALLLAMRGNAGWTPSTLALVAAGVLLLAIFFWQERRAPEPMLPLNLFKNPVIGLSCLSTFMVGGVMMGTSVYLPLWAQGVQGFSATQSGISLLWLSIGWPIAAFVGGRFIMKMGMRPSALLGLSLNLAGAVVLTILARTMHNIPSLALAIVTFVIGSGMGFSTLAFILGVQNSVETAQRGVATASLTFLRNLGGLVWLSAMGAAMNATLLPQMRTVPGLVNRSAAELGQLANKLLDPRSWGEIPPGLLEHLREALAVSLRNVHLLMVLAAFISLVVIIFIPNMRFSNETRPHPADSPGH